MIPGKFWLYDEMGDIMTFSIYERRRGGLDYLGIPYNRPTTSTLVKMIRIRSTTMTRSQRVVKTDSKSKNVRKICDACFESLIQIMHTSQACNFQRHHRLPSPVPLSRPTYE